MTGLTNNQYQSFIKLERASFYQPITNQSNCQPIKKQSTYQKNRLKAA
jgi:hypothetical protein